jgi:hypothetical protein
MHSSCSLSLRVTSNTITRKANEAKESTGGPGAIFVAYAPTLSIQNATFRSTGLGGRSRSCSIANPCPARSIQQREAANSCGKLEPAFHVRSHTPMPRNILAVTQRPGVFSRSCDRRQRTCRAVCADLITGERKLGHRRGCSTRSGRHSWPSIHRHHNPITSRPQEFTSLASEGTVGSFYLVLGFRPRDPRSHPLCVKEHRYLGCG